MYVFLLVMNSVVWLTILFFYARWRGASLFHPATYYLLVHGIVFVIRPWLAWAYDFRQVYYTYGFMPTDATKNIALAAASLGLVSFMAAVTYFGNAPLRLAPTPMTARGAAMARLTYLGITIVLLPLALLSTRTVIDTRINASSTMIRDAATGYAVNTSTSGYFTDASLMLLPIVTVLMWVFRFRWWTFAPVAVAVLMRAATGSRWPFVMACLSLCLFYLYDRRSRWPNGRVLAMGAAVIALFTLVGADRGASVRALFGAEDKQETTVAAKERPLESMDYGNLEFLEYIVDTIPEKTRTYDYFLDNLQILTEPIPRIWWPGKPVGSPIQLYSLYDYGYPIGMTFSVPGEGWAQLGWVGVVLWSGLFGWAYGRIYNGFMRSRQRIYQVALFMIFMPMSIGVFRDGFLLTVFKTSLFTLLPLILWGLLLRYGPWPVALMARPVRSGGYRVVQDVPAGRVRRPKRITASAP